MKKDFTPAFEPEKEFHSISLSVASPEDILSWSHGEVTKPETINYRTQKPESDGLFCEKIFGPVKNWECACGKYKRIRYKGIVCEKCGVEVIHSSVRRERMGHIKLAVPVTHPWFLRSTPSKIGLLLNLPVRKLELVVYFAAYIVIEVDEEAQVEELGKLEQEYKKIIEKLKEENSIALKAAKSAVKKNEMTEKDYGKFEIELVQKLEEVAENFKAAREELKMIQVGEVLTELQYRNTSMKFGHIFRAGIGADAIREIIQQINLPKFVEKLIEELKNSTGQKQKKLVKRIKLVKSLIKNKTKPEWMIMTVIPVISPDLRPMVQLDGGRFATSDLNDLYRRVINRNARLKKLIQLGAPEIICRNEKRMLQEAVDILISNSSRSTRSGMNYTQRRKLKSLSDMLKGKQGRFRQNLLGKRVDYSGRSVIAVGPTLKLDECGLPKKITLELFKPFVIAKLIEFELAFNVKSAERMIREGEPVVWDILAEVIEGKYVLLNRAPTLHRLGIQAFRPRLVDGKAIRLHPLVCAAYNADFDGDQMAVYLPLSTKAQEEARTIMCSSKNLLKPSSGDPIINPSQDMVLGCYFLTQEFNGKQGEGKAFFSPAEAILAYESGQIHLQAPIKVRIESGLLETTVGRLIFNEVVPKELGYQNHSFGKKELSALLAETFSKSGVPATAKLADDIKDLGFKYATKSGISISVFDLLESPNRDTVIEGANKLVSTISHHYRCGLSTDDERYNGTIKIWSRVKSEITEEMIQQYEPENDIFYQINSGARGNWGQVTQIAGMKGLVSSPSGRTIELPIRSNLKRGFSILEYFNATHGGRKGKSDTALKTAEAGYLTRRLVDSGQDVVVHEEDCGTDIGKTISRIDSAKLGMDFARRIRGRALLEDVMVGKKVVLKKGDILDEVAMAIIQEQEVQEVTVRSVMYCRTRNGVCQKCYGYDLGNNKVVSFGTPVGIIAAQSIGEPGTQLTMRTFHMGGIATEGMSMTQGLSRVEELFEARSPSNPALLAEISGKVSIKKGKNDTRVSVEAAKAEKDEYVLQYEMDPVVKKGEIVKEKQVLARSTENKDTIRARCAGEVVSTEEGVIVVRQDVAAKKQYTISTRATLLIQDGAEVKKGEAITNGHIDLRQLMELASVERAQAYILNEVQNIYASQGQDIDEKHIEIIVKQMASKVRVIDSGDSEWVAGEIHDVIEWERECEGLRKAKKKEVRVERLLLGLTRIALWTDSWLSAASFQETIRALVNASVECKEDTLDGLKENVIIGRLIPAGTGYKGARAN
jgi:DNA-directed RNA polymerase subunit beta'